MGVLFGGEEFIDVELDPKELVDKVLELEDAIIV